MYAGGASRTSEKNVQSWLRLTVVVGFAHVGVTFLPPTSSIANQLANGPGASAGHCKVTEAATHVLHTCCSFVELLTELFLPKKSLVLCHLNARRASSVLRTRLVCSPCTVCPQAHFSPPTNFHPLTLTRQLPRGLRRRPLLILARHLASTKSDHWKSLEESCPSTGSPRTDSGYVVGVADVGSVFGV